MSALITKPGIYPDMSEVDYFADPCPQPSLSHSIARLLLDRSPMHAAAAHPRLLGEMPETVSAAMDEGSILHALLLGRGSKFVALPYADYRTKEAQEARDEARAQGLIPVLHDKLESLRACAKAVEAAIRAHPDCQAFFEPGTSEAVIAWEENGIWCRGLIDRLPNDPRAPIFDLKTTAMSAAPQDWERSLIRSYCTQDAFYRRGWRALRYPDRPFLFIVAERQAPYGVTVMACGASLRDYAERRMARAVALWRQCMEADQWPGYAPMTAYVEAPAYLLDIEAGDIMQRQSAATATEIDDDILEEILR